MVRIGSFLLLRAITANEPARAPAGGRRRGGAHARRAGRHRLPAVVGNHSWVLPLQADGL